MKSEKFPDIKKKSPFDLEESIKKMINSMQTRKFDTVSINSLINELKKSFRNMDELSRIVFYRRLEDLQGTLMLYSYGFYSNTIVDIYGLLERTMINMLPDLLPTFKGKRVALENLMSYQNLDGLAKSFMLLEILDNEDLRRIQKLKKRRDSLAHKNIKKISTLFSKNEKTIDYFSLDSTVHENDVRPIVIDSFKILLKLSYGYAEHFPRHYIAKAILENKITYESEAGKLFDI